MSWTGRVPRWGHLGQVRKADIYLRSSLFLVVWIVPGTIALALVGQEADGGLGSGGGAWVLLVTALTCVAGTVLLREVIPLYPARGPLPRRSLALMAGVLVLAVVVARLLGQDLGGPLTVLVSVVMATAAGGLADGRVTAGVASACFVVPLAGAGSVTGAFVVVGYGLFLVFTVRSSLWLYEVVAELDRARQAHGALAVAEERLRFSRDVHDVLGRHLSRIAVTAELAATLARRGDERAEQQMLQVREDAHDALREARELARGYRETDLDTELEGARSLLASAGIRTTVAVEGLPPRWREAAAWVVREAVTNVLRHSRAREVRIGWDGTALTVADDGGPVAAAAGGSGLHGLQERVAPLGATIESGATEEGYRVTMRTAVDKATRATGAVGGGR